MSWGGKMKNSKINLLSWSSKTLGLVNMLQAWVELPSYQLMQKEEHINPIITLKPLWLDLASTKWSTWRLKALAHSTLGLLNSSGIKQEVPSVELHMATQQTKIQYQWLIKRETVSNITTPIASDMITGARTDWFRQESNRNFSTWPKILKSKTWQHQSLAAKTVQMKNHSSTRASSIPFNRLNQ